MFTDIRRKYSINFNMGWLLYRVSLPIKWQQRAGFTVSNHAKVTQLIR